MFEAEINHMKEQPSELSPDALASFVETREQIAERSVIPWGSTARSVRCPNATVPVTCMMHERTE